MNDKTAKISRRWLNPSAALSRFKPPSGLATGIASVERQRARYGFQVGGVNLLVGQDTVSEVLEQTLIYPLPNTPPWMLGLVNLRGNLAPVFDVKRFLDLEDSADQDKRRLLVFDQGDKAVGILIDGLPRIAAIDHALSRLPPLPTALRTHVTKAYAQHGVIWLEFDHRSFFQTLGGQVARVP